MRDPFFANSGSDNPIGQYVSEVEDIALKKLVKGVKNNELEGITNALSYAGNMTGMLNSLKNE
jgi:hypothetical protein